MDSDIINTATVRTAVVILYGGVCSACDPEQALFIFLHNGFYAVFFRNLCVQKKNLHTSGAFAYIRPWKLTVVNIEKPLFSTVSEIRNACELTQRHVNGGETNHPPGSDPSPGLLQTTRLS